MASEVTIDTDELERAFRRLSTGLTEGGRAGAARQALRTAADIRAATPVRSGRLVSTVATRTAGDASEVLYGGTLPYAGYIAKRTGNVSDALDGVGNDFAASMLAVAKTEAAQL